MYVVRRPFRNFGVTLEPGSVVELASIKRHKSRLNDRYIVEVNQDNFSSWQQYFKERHSVDLVMPEAPKVPDTLEVPKVPDTPEAPEAPEAPKVVVSAVAKPKA